MDPLIAKSVHRLKLAFLICVAFGAVSGLAGLPLSWWLLVPLTVLACWATWPAQIFHWRQCKSDGYRQ